MTIEWAAQLGLSKSPNGLNPCSNGMTIEYSTRYRWRCHFGILNPCSNGMTIEFAEAKAGVGLQ